MLALQANAHLFVVDDPARGLQVAVDGRGVHRHVTLTRLRSADGARLRRSRVHFRGEGHLATNNQSTWKR